MKLQNLEMKRHYISDKFIIGIDPAKNKHQAMVLDPKGIPVKTNTRPWFLIPKEFLSGNPFLFKVLTMVSTLNSGKN